MVRCKQCILPETVPGIEFNAEGICNFCETFTPHKVLGEKELQSIVKRAKAQNKEYDCIVPLSGGRDSAYVAYLATKRYKMKVLAVNYNNGFQVPGTAQNVANVCAALDIDYQVRFSKNHRANKVVKYNLLAKKGVCSACTFGYHSAPYQAAQKYAIPLIIWGTSKVENTARMSTKINTTINPKNTILDKVKRRVKNYLNKDWYFFEYQFFLHRLEFPVPGMSPLKKKILHPSKRKTQEISLFDYIEWDRREIKRVIMEELNWEKPAGKSSTWRTDCHLHSFENWTFLKKYGCTKDSFGYCNMINAGQMTREEALNQELEMIHELSDESMQSLLVEQVGMSVMKTNKVMMQVTK